MCITTRSRSFTFDRADTINGPYCETYFNPLPITTGLLSTTTTLHLTQWTVTAQYATVTESTSTYNVPVVSGSAIVSSPTTSYTDLATSSHLYSIVTGEYGATVVAPYIVVRWQTTDQFVLDWLKSQSLPFKNNSALTPSPSPPLAPLSKSGISDGAIGGIVVGAVAISLCSSVVSIFAYAEESVGSTSHQWQAKT
jgi:hypothetical protein